MAIFSQPIQLTGTLTPQASLSATLSTTARLTGALTMPEGVNVPKYEGDYEVTPTEETITLSTNNLQMTHNVTINPIPSNYGLITWNGTTLTVS